MIVVSDTSTVKGLIAINNTFILKELFEEIYIPSAVCHELEKMSFLKYEVKCFLSERWVKTARCTNFKLLKHLINHLIPVKVKQYVFVRRLMPGFC